MNKINYPLLISSLMHEYHNKVSSLRRTGKQHLLNGDKYLYDTVCCELKGMDNIINMLKNRGLIK